MIKKLNHKIKVNRGKLLATVSLLTLGLPSSNSFADPTKNYYSGTVQGGIGLMETRTARFAPDGSFEFGASFVNPYRRYFLNWQVFPWMEATFRYVDPTNNVFGGQIWDMPQSTFFSNLAKFTSGGTSIDRGFDIKFKIFSEKGWRPAVAVGLQDFIGTGRFNGEYVVASKKIGDFDLTLGMGWGHNGSKGGFKNPLKLLGDSFSSRERSVGLGGKASFGHFFRGEKVSLFGGVEYLTPYRGLTLKAEFNGSDIKKDRDVFDEFVHIRESFPINLGVNYRVAKWLDTTIAWERGNSIMLRLALKANFNKQGIKKNNFVPPKLLPRPKNKDYMTTPENKKKIEEGPSSLRQARFQLQELYSQLEHKGFKVSSYKIDKNKGHLAIECSPQNKKSCIPDEYLNSIIFQNAPEKINQILLSLSLDGEKLKPITINKKNPSKKISQQMISDLNNENSLFDNRGLIKEVKLLSHELERQGSSIEFLKQVESEKESLKEDQPKKYAYNATEADFIKYISNEEINQKATLSENVEEKETPPNSSLISAAIMRDLTGYGFWGHSVFLDKYEAFVYLSNWPYRNGAQNLGLAGKVIANRLPEEIETITIVELMGSIERSRVSISRKDLEKSETNQTSLEETWLNTEIKQPKAGMKEVNKGFVNPLTYPSKRWFIAPQLKQHIGNPDTGVYIADLNMELGGSYSPLPGLSFSAVGEFYLFGNLDTITRKSDSRLHHVRSDIVSYLQQGRNNIKQLQASYFESIAPNLYGRVTAGIFEAMYGGVGGELLYRPFGKRWALGSEINWVKQRDFNQLFRFRNYNTITSHLTLYYDLPFYNLRTKISAGKYLAGDRGVTFEISREFKSGVRIGAFATFTNVSAEDFGEGSFDKGFYIKFPLELLLTKKSKQSQIFVFRPLTRDGGQRVNVGPGLFALTDERTPYQYRESWSSFYSK